MRNLDVPLVKAMELLGIPEEDRPAIIAKMGQYKPTWRRESGRSIRSERCRMRTALIKRHKIVFGNGVACGLGRFDLLRAFQ